MKTTGALVSLTVFVWASPAFSQCIAGPDAPSERALQTAFEAQAAIADHLGVAELDRHSRELSDVVSERELRRGAATAQATLNFETSAVRGFSVCDATAWERAKLQNQALGAAASVGSRGVARLEMRLYGVSDSIIQRDLGQYYPEREVGAQAAVPGATGAGHGVWSTRVELLDAVNLTVGRVSTHEIQHSVGWDEETDENGDTSITKSETTHWGAGADGRTFVALGVPRFGSSDLVLGAAGVERLHAGSGWIVPRPRDPAVAFRLDAGWDGLIDAPTMGAEAIPLLRPFDTRGLPTFRLRAATELTTSALREASVSARWSYSYEQAGIAVPGELAGFELQSGLYGGSRLRDVSGSPFVPGVSARLDAAVPFYGVFRVATWAGINRASTIAAVPDAAGRPEWGLSVYATFAL